MMHFLYLDESGSPPNKNEDYYVLAGLSVPEFSVRWLSNQIQVFVNNNLPINSHEEELHASVIFNGNKFPWNKMERGNRIKIIRNALHILDNANQCITIFAYAVHKDSFPGDDLVLKAYEDITSRFDLYLTTISEENKELNRGMIILDNSSDEMSIQHQAKRFREEGNRWGSQLRNIIEVPLFIDSKESRIIQLADLVAHSVFRRYNAEDISYFNCIQNRFHARDGKIHGLAHQHRLKVTCTCPSCLTRK